MHHQKYMLAIKETFFLHTYTKKFQATSILRDSPVHQTSCSCSTGRRTRSQPRHPERCPSTSITGPLQNTQPFTETVTRWEYCALMPLWCQTPPKPNEHKSDNLTPLIRYIYKTKKTCLLCIMHNYVCKKNHETPKKRKLLKKANIRNMSKRRKRRNFENFLGAYPKEFWSLVKPGEEIPLPTCRGWLTCGPEKVFAWGSWGVPWTWVSGKKLLAGLQLRLGATHRGGFSWCAWWHFPQRG